MRLVLTSAYGLSSWMVKLVADAKRAAAESLPTFPNTILDACGPFASIRRTPFVAVASYIYTSEDVNQARARINSPHCRRIRGTCILWGVHDIEEIDEVLYSRLGEPFNGVMAQCSFRIKH